MSKHDSSLRKAVILIASLDAPTAEMLLAQMPPEQADAVRHMAQQLESIDPNEQDAIIEEFFRISPLIPETDPPGLEIDDGLARRFAPPIDDYANASGKIGRKSSSPGNIDQTGDNTPFHFLQDTAPTSLVPFLEREHPQAVALVLSHLPPARAGDVLAQLPASIQAEVIRRMVDLEETDPQVLRDVERAVEVWLQSQQPQRRRVAGMAAVSAILNSADGVARRQILSNLAVHDRSLAHKFAQPAGQRRLTFADLCEFDTDSLTRVLRAADGEMVLLALVGTPPDLVDRLLDRLPPDEAPWLSKGLEHLGPTRLADIDRAQESLADLANHMLADGRLPGIDFSHLTAVA